MYVTQQERIEVLNKYGTFDILVNDVDGSFSVRFAGTHNFSRFGWSYRNKDNAIRGLYDALQGSLVLICVDIGGNLDYDYDYPTDA